MATAEMPTAMRVGRGDQVEMYGPGGPTLVHALRPKALVPGDE
jgi:hypothetical protein